MEARRAASAIRRSRVRTQPKPTGAAATVTALGGRLPDGGVRQARYSDLWTSRSSRAASTAARFSTSVTVPCCQL
eukprot:5936110-Karenia_brevis.AAC.1